MQGFKFLTIIKGWFEIKYGTRLGFTHINVGHLAWLAEINEVNVKYISMQFLFSCEGVKLLNPIFLLKYKMTYWNFLYVTCGLVHLKSSWAL